MPDYLPIAPDNAIDVDNKPAVRIVKFGDGEEQRAPAGLNNDLGMWNITYDQKPPEIVMPVYDFLKSLRGYKAFYFKPYDDEPSDPPRLVVCDSYSKKYHYGSKEVMSLNAKLREVVR